MACMSYKLDGIETLLSAIGDIPDAVADEMLQAGAEVLRDAQEKSARKILTGPYVTGATAASIKVGKVKRDKGGAKAITVGPQGTRPDGKRAAEIAFLNEYGVSRKHIAPRPFIRLANTQSEKAVEEAEQRVLNQHIDSKL